jgi:hypothetical protein
MRRWLLNRVTITLGSIALVVLAWNIYVLAHDDGVLEGRVVGPDGAPVAGVEVVLNEQSIVSLTPILRVTTDAQGRFHFVDHGRHNLVITAAKAGVGRSDRVRVRLLFRNQNRQLDEPVRLQAS